MSNHYDREKSGTHLRRFLTRCYKSYKHQPLIMDDISVVHLDERDGTAYEARRDQSGAWSVYRTYSVSYGKQRRHVHESLGVSLTLEKALDMLQNRCPEGMARNKDEYNHPLQIAKIIKYEFADPAG